ncbi:hypothetical protein ACVWXO_008106 [Bradyrhizobium sp. LM2.7]
MAFPFQIDISASCNFATRIRDVHFPGQEIIKIRRTETGQAGQCYENVRRAVRQRGGRAQLGWLLSMWPGRFIEALHHAVWLTPEGDLEDVTIADFPGAKGDTTTFIEDTRLLTEYDPQVASKFIALAIDRTTAAFIEATIERMKYQSKLWDYIAKMSVPFHRRADGQAEISITTQTKDKLTRLSQKAAAMADAKERHCLDMLREDRSCRADSSGACTCGSGLSFASCHALLDSPGRGTVR